MRLRAHALSAHLKKGLAPLYLLTGDEPLQIGEVADAIRKQAHADGYTVRDLIEIGRGFDWNELAAVANNLSLFAERRIIDLRIPSGKPGSDGGKALTEYAGRPPEDTLLLITLPKLERSQTTSKWFKALDKAGVVIQIWPIEGAQLPPWIEQRMHSRKLTPAPNVVSMLAERIEGNLLAAAQEIDKLLLLNGPGIVSEEQLATSVADSARFNVYALVDSALEGKVTRALRILNGLRAEGTPPPVILWALSREIRLLAGLAYDIDKGCSPQQAVAARREIWDNRKSLVSRGLSRMKNPQWQQLLRLCSRTDRAIKGRDQTDPWLLLQEITCRMAGTPVIDKI